MGVKRITAAQRRQMGRILGRLSRASQTQAERSAQASNAAKTRWANWRAAKAAAEGDGK